MLKDMFLQKAYNRCSIFSLDCSKSGIATSLMTLCSIPLICAISRIRSGYQANSGLLFFLNLDHGLRLDSFPIDFSPETWRLRYVHVAVSDFGRFFN